MVKISLQGNESKRNGFVIDAGIGNPWNPQEDCFHPGGLFASLGQVGLGFGISTNSPDSRTNSKGNDLNLPYTNLYTKYVSTPERELRFYSTQVGEEELVVNNDKKKKKSGFVLKIKVGNPSLRRLISGAVAGAVSRTVVAPLETIRTHLMVGSCGNSTSEVFDSIIKTDGWTGLFRGNFVNVIRVAPSKGIELFVYDSVNKSLTPKDGEQATNPIPPSLLAGAAAGVCSTVCTYPLELLKTRLTIQRGVYKNFLDAFVKIVQEEGPAELFRGLTPSIIGVIPYAATNYYAYDTLRKAYRKGLDQEEVGNIMTLLIGSAAGVISSTATFPLEVARKHMQAGALNGRQYKNMLHALATILEKEGVSGLYRGLGASCMKLVPAAGISFMCYEACKRILIEKEDDHIQ